MIANLIKWSLENRLIIVGLGLVLFIFGGYYTTNTPIDVLPKFAPPQVIIQTNAPGLASEEVESVITIPLESALNGTNKVKIVRSSSVEGLSFIQVIFDWGTDIYTARQLVTEKIQLVSANFPKNIHTPILSPITSPIGSVYYFALTCKGFPMMASTSLMDLRTYADWEIKHKLLSIPGVAKVQTYGGEVKQYQILLNPNKLKQYNITLNQVLNAAEEANVVIGGGYLVQNDREYLIRGIGRIESINDLANSTVLEKNGVPIKLRDIAKVKIGSAFKKSFGSINGKEAVIIAVSKQPWVNTIEINKKIEQTLQELRKTLPGDIEIKETYNQSNFINASIRNILFAILQGSVLVIIILFIFLANWRTSFITITVIPLSIIVAILILKSFGQTINAMTLGGLAVSIGEIVDDAIIDVENIYKRLRQNKLSPNPRPVLDVIFNASYEVRHSVVYGTYIIIVVLVPVLFLSGLAGQIFKPLAWAYIISILASLLVALILTPALSYYFLVKEENIRNEEPKILIKIKENYLSILKGVYKKEKIILFSVLISFVLSICIFFTLGYSFLPELGEENLVVMAIAPPGTNLQVTQDIALNMEKVFKKYKEIINVGNRAGRSENDNEPISSNLSHFDISLKEGISQSSKDKLIKNIRDGFAKIPGLATIIRSFISETIDDVISGQKAPIVIKLYGSDLQVLRKYINEISNILKRVHSLNEIQIEPITDIPQVHIKIKQEVASRYGLKVGELLKTIQVYFNGITTTQKILEGQKTFDILIWLDKPFRNSLEVIQNTLIDTPSGKKIPLNQIANVFESKGPNIINREKNSRRIVITANAEKKDISKAVEQVQRLLEQKLVLPSGYFLEIEGEYKQQKEANQQLFLLSVLVVLFIYLMLSLAFKSFKTSLIIMLNLPLALIGGVIAIVLTSGIVSIASVIGFITLFGISTRNTILLVNRFIDLKKENPDLGIEKIIELGTQDRLAPILMTALAAACGMLPLALFPQAGTEIEHPLAIVILGGMISATFLTLIVIPLMYRKFES